MKKRRNLESKRLLASLILVALVSACAIANPVEEKLSPVVVAGQCIDELVGKGYINCDQVREGQLDISILRSTLHLYDSLTVRERIKGVVPDGRAYGCWVGAHDGVVGWISISNTARRLIQVNDVAWDFMDFFRDRFGEQPIEVYEELYDEVYEELLEATVKHGLRSNEAPTVCQ